MNIVLKLWCFLHSRIQL